MNLVNAEVQEVIQGPVKIEECDDDGYNIYWKMTVRLNAYGQEIEQVYITRSEQEAKNIEEGYKDTIKV